VLVQGDASRTREGVSITEGKGPARRRPQPSTFCVALAAIA